MLHDFAITENFAIVPDLPFEFKPEKAMEGGHIFTYNKEAKASYLILNRNSQDVKETRQFELPNHYVFHFANAWEDTNEQGQKVIILFGCAYTDISLGLLDEHPFGKLKYPNKLTKFVFNLETGQSDMKVVIDNVSTDFPVVDQHRVGYKTRYCYLT